MLEYILTFIIGFFAQMVDGMLGMGYGVTSNTFLLMLGLPPYLASATIHQAEVFTTLSSGLSHFKLGNVDKKLVVRLAVPGCIGGAVGAYALVNFQVPVVATLVKLYLTLMGGVIILRAFRINLFFRRVNIPFLGGIGGLLDAMGGGGWGPVVTGTLIANGHNPKKSIGSVNLSEFFVTLVQSLTFVTLIGLGNVMFIIPLIIGGLIASPVAAYLCKKANIKMLLILVGLLLILTNLYGLVR